MAESRIDMRVDGAARFRDAALQLQDAGRKDLKNALAKRIRAEGRPTVQDVRAAVRATPSKGTRGGGSKGRGGRGLRALIASATQVTTSASKSNPSIKIRVSSARFKTEQNPATLPKYLDGELTRFSRWRHKTFGKAEFKDGRSAWFPQDSHPYFFVTIRRHRDGFRKAILTAIDDVLDELSHG